MFNFFKSKEYKKANQLIAKTTLDNDTLISLLIEINQIVAILNNNSQIFTQLLEVLQEKQLTPLKSVKMMLIFYRYIQCCKNSQHFQQVFKFIKKLDVKVQDLLRKSKNKRKQNVNYGRQKYSLDTSKDMMRQPEFQCQNFGEIVMAKVVLPMILVLEKIIFSYEDMQKKGKDRDSNEFRWTELNFLRKISQLNVYIQDLGRYFPQESNIMVLVLMKIISFDIHKNYKAINDFAYTKMATIQSLMEQNRLTTKQQLKEQSIQQFLIFIYELQFLNEDLRLLYCGKYFAFQLMQNKIFCPSQFKSKVQIIDQLYLLTRKGQNLNVTKLNNSTSVSFKKKRKYEHLQTI